MLLLNLSQLLAPASLVTQTVKNLPAMQETQVQFLFGDNPVEKGMATHTSILAWKTPRTEQPGGLQSVGPQSRAYAHMNTGVPVLEFFRFLWTCA